MDGVGRRLPICNAWVDSIMGNPGIICQVCSKDAHEFGLILLFQGISDSNICD
jgi:hypothetical protein